MQSSLQVNHTRIYIAAALTVLLLASLATADVLDLKVNDDGLAVVHEHPKIVVNSAGQFIVVWADQRNGQSDIFAQRFSASGSPLSINQQVNSDTGRAWQMAPAIARTPDNKYLAVWQDYRNGAYPFGSDIYFQRLDTSSLPVNSNTNLTTELPDSLKEGADIDVGPDGKAVVVWADYRNRNWDIYGQVLAADGTPVGSNFKINDDLNLAQQHAPRVSISPEGWFVVTWYDNRQGNDDIFVQRFDPAGTKISTNKRINSDVTTSRQAFPDIAADGRGHFTVVWVDWRNGTYPANPDIYARRFDTLLQPLTLDLRVNTDASVRAQREPAIASDRMGNVAIVWADSGATSWDVGGQMIDAEGVVRVANFRANLLADSAQLQPDVALDGRNRYITWADKRAGGFDIYASVSQYNDMRLKVSPLSLNFTVNAGGPLPAAQQLTVEQYGFNALGFKIVSSETWIQCSPATASTPQTVDVSVSQLLALGTYQATLTMIDTVNHDSSLVVPVNMTVSIPQSGDSVIVGAVAVRPSQFINLPVELYLGTARKLATIPLVFNSTYFTVSSVSLGAGLTGHAAVSTPVNAAGQVVLRLTANTGDSLPTGKYVAATIRVHATTSQGLAIVDSATIDSFSVQLKAAAGSLFKPAFTPGEVNVNILTDADDIDAPAAILQLSLAQNYPNPFNLATHISFVLPSRSEVKLEIFNVLGQRVATVVDLSLSAGEHSYAWDGREENGGTVPSGIYFYRLQAGGRSLVRKLVVLK